MANRGIDFLFKSFEREVASQRDSQHVSLILQKGTVSLWNVIWKG